MPARPSVTGTARTAPVVPTPVVSVELTDLRQRGAPLAVLVAPSTADQPGGQSFDGGGPDADSPARRPNTGAAGTGSGVESPASAAGSSRAARVGTHPAGRVRTVRGPVGAVQDHAAPEADPASHERGLVGRDFDAGPGSAQDWASVEAGPWFGPGTRWLPDGWRDLVDVSGRPGEVRVIPRRPGPGPAVRWLVGIGSRSADDWRSAGAALIRSALDVAESDDAGQTGGQHADRTPDDTNRAAAQPAAAQPADAQPDRARAADARPDRAARADARLDTGRPVGARPAGAVPGRAEWSPTGSSAAPPTLDVALPADVSADELTAFVFGIVLGGYRFVVTGEGRPTPVRTVRLCVDEPHDDGLVDRLRPAVRRAEVLGSATALARDLANMPSNVKDPAWLGGIATRIAAGTPGLTVTVHDEQWLADKGFGGVLAVGSGSVSPPRLIELTWRPRGAAGAPHLVLVGKGVTFDTGGISLKPAAGMQLMRTDMSGAAAVIAAMRAVAQLRLPIRVTGLAPAAENHVSGSAYRPGDVVRHYGGTTTEVTNTDAEGRMLLADTLAYAVRRHRPDLLVDVATLTGAMKISLGTRTAGVFATTAELAARVRAAGDAVGERWWRMPLLDEFVDDVAGDFADLRQCPPGPGSITAALFLREFTAGLPWAHLDIAGPARSESTYAEVVPGATGFAARTLIALAESLAE